MLLIIVVGFLLIFINLFSSLELKDKYIKELKDKLEYYEPGSWSHDYNFYLEQWQYPYWDKEKIDDTKLVAVTGKYPIYVTNRFGITQYIDSVIIIDTKLNKVSREFVNKADIVKYNRKRSNNEKK